MAYVWALCLIMVANKQSMKLCNISVNQTLLYKLINLQLRLQNFVRSSIKAHNPNFSIWFKKDFKYSTHRNKEIVNQTTAMWGKVETSLNELPRKEQANHLFIERGGTV